MLNPAGMSKITVAGHKGYMDAVVKELHKLKVLHIEDHTKNDFADIGSPSSQASSLSESLLKIRSFMSSFNIKDEEFIESGEKPSLSRINSEIGSISRKVNDIQEKVMGLQAKISRNSSLIAELKKLDGLDIPLEALSGYRSIVYFIGTVRDSEILRQGIEKSGAHFKLYISSDNPRLVALFVESSKKGQAFEILGKSQFSGVPLANISGLSGMPSKNIEKFAGDNSRLSVQLESLKKDMVKIGMESRSFLLNSEKFLREEVEKAEAPLRFASTKNAFVLKGWAPAENIRTLLARLEKISKGGLFVHFDQPNRHDNVPVKLTNKKIAKPFEFFMEIYTLPVYREIDPTFFIFITFPLLFGFMLGDIGYGLVTLVLFALLRKIMPRGKSLFNILIFASVSTMLFGLLFGEFFGAEEIGHFRLPHILSRAHDVMLLLYVAVAVGVLHLNLGLILGFINEKKSHGFIHAFYAKLGWVVLQLGVGLLAAHYSGFLQLPAYAGFAVIALSIFMIINGEGIRGLIEIPGIFSNILSYARLMAIALSSVMLAIVINESALKLFHGGIASLIAGVLILVVGHAINLGLGLLGSFLHSLRLHYVEFFTKFFHGGGKKYSPFGA